MSADKNVVAESAKRKQCPCEFEEIEPCHYACTCHNSFMSGGCRRCCRYGSPEQQLEMARFLVSTEQNKGTTMTETPWRSPKEQPLDGKWICVICKDGSMAHFRSSEIEFSVSDDRWAYVDDLLAMPIRSHTRKCKYCNVVLHPAASGDECLSVKCLKVQRDVATSRAEKAEADFKEKDAQFAAWRETFYKMRDERDMWKLRAGGL